MTRLPLLFPVKPVSPEALAGLREILAGVSVAASKVVPALRMASARSRLRAAHRIADGPSRHRAVKHARDILRHERKQAARRYR